MKLQVVNPTFKQTFSCDSSPSYVSQGYFHLQTIWRTQCNTTGLDLADPQQLLNLYVVQGASLIEDPK